MFDQQAFFAWPALVGIVEDKLLPVAPKAVADIAGFVQAKLDLISAAAYAT
jgi:hypothetical protein